MRQLICRGFCFTGKMHPNDRSRLTFMIRYAARHPERVVPHARRLARDAVLRLKNRDHVSYYRAVMRSDAARSDEGAVGSHTHESWLKIGQMQFDYLVAHGLKPGMRMLEIGCGNLRAGRLFIEYLDAGDYHGIDISPDILLAAQRTLAEAGLQHKLPHLTLVQDLKLEFLPAGHFDVVHAHSVFSHSPVEVIEECLAHVGRVMKPDGFFDFTFDRTEGAEHQVLREDFYYRTETLVALAGRYGLIGQFMTDWEKLPHQQSKLHITRPAELRYIAILESDGRECHGGDRRGRWGARGAGDRREPGDNGGRVQCRERVRCGERVRRFAIALKSSVRRAGRWRVPERYTTVVYKGGGWLDLRAAELSGPVTTFVTVAYKSRVTILVPANVRVEMTGFGVTQGADDEDPGYRLPADAPVIHVRGIAYKGTVEIATRPPERHALPG
jgi:ubiquinone/menaquinone biosynthesis C-methylase UbiE